MGDSVRLEYLPDWIKECPSPQLNSVEKRQQFIEDLIASQLHRQSIHPGRLNDRTICVSYTGHYWLEETRSNKMNVKSFRDWLYTKDCWNRVGRWVQVGRLTEFRLHGGYN